MSADKASSAARFEARSWLLGFRCIEETQVPSELSCFRAREWMQPELEAMSPSKGSKAGDDTPARQTSFSSTTPASRRSDFGRQASFGTVPDFHRAITPSENAYRPQTPMQRQVSRPRNQELQRQVQSHLNKICPENVSTIGEKLAEIVLEDAADLKLLISVIFKKALVEPHYCETYADLVFSLKSAYSEFPQPEGKPVTFKSTLLNICQDEFEALPTHLEPTAEELDQCDKEEIERRIKNKKDRLLANMKFIGHLFLRQLLSAKVIGSVLLELVLCGNETEVPQEHVIECACELLLNIGATLESMPSGAAAVSSVCGRLKDLKTRKGQDLLCVYSKRIQFAIQDLIEIRAAGWAKKSFKISAKTKEEIRLGQQREMVAASRGKDVDGSEHVVAGQRPQYIEAQRQAAKDGR